MGRGFLSGPLACLRAISAIDRGFAAGYWTPTRHLPRRRAERRCPARNQERGSDGARIDIRTAWPGDYPCLAGRSIEATAERLLASAVRARTDKGRAAGRRPHS